MRRHDLIAGALASAAALALALLAAALLAMALTREAGGIALFWPVNGLLAGVLLRLPRGRQPLAVAAGFAAIMAANLLHGDALRLAAGLAGCNLLEVLLACHLARRCAGPAVQLADLRQLFVLLCLFPQIALWLPELLMGPGF